MITQVIFASIGDNFWHLNFLSSGFPNMFWVNGDFFLGCSLVAETNFFYSSTFSITRFISSRILIAMLLPTLLFLGIEFLVGLCILHVGVLATASCCLSPFGLHLLPFSLFCSFVYALEFVMGGVKVPR